MIEIRFGAHESVKKDGSTLGFFVRYNPPFREPTPRYVGMESFFLEPLIGDAVENLYRFARDAPVKVIVDPNIVNSDASLIQNEFDIYAQLTNVSVEYARAESS